MFLPDILRFYDNFNVNKYNNTQKYKHVHVAKICKIIRFEIYSLYNLI